MASAAIRWSLVCVGICKYLLTAPVPPVPVFPKMSVTGSLGLLLSRTATTSVVRVFEPGILMGVFEPIR